MLAAGGLAKSFTWLVSRRNVRYGSAAAGRWTCRTPLCCEVRGAENGAWSTVDRDAHPVFVSPMPIVRDLRRD